MRTWRRKEFRKDATVFKGNGRIKEAERPSQKTEEEQSRECTGCVQRLVCCARVAQESTVNGLGTGLGASFA